MKVKWHRGYKVSALCTRAGKKRIRPLNRYVLIIRTTFSAPRWGPGPIPMLYFGPINLDLAIPADGFCNDKNKKKKTVNILFSST